MTYGQYFLETAHYLISKGTRRSAPNPILAAALGPEIVLTRPNPKQGELYLVH